jgi:hypothetical protein
MNKTKILKLSFESTESETESQQSTLQLQESVVVYTEILWNVFSFVKYH